MNIAIYFDDSKLLLVTGGSKRILINGARC